MAVLHASFGTQESQEPLLGLASMMRMVFAGDDLAALASRLIDRVRRDPRDANAMLDLSTALQLRFQPELGLAAQAQALCVQQLYHLGARPDRASVRVLVMVAPGDMMTNIPLDCLLEGFDVSLHLLYAAPDRPLPNLIPEHDLIIVAVGEPDRNRVALQRIAEFLKQSSLPVLNPPERSLSLTRDGACDLLRSAQGVSMPTTARVTRDILRQIAHGDVPVASLIGGDDFPIIVRPVGSHAGRSLARIDRCSALVDYLQETTGAEFYISRFVDYRSPDGQFRKYRVVLIEGIPYACHMGISDDWMIHYLNAGMSESAEKRAEEERFMATFDDDFAARHRHAFAAIQEKMGLDYIGIDCGELNSGELLIFEVDTGMIVHAMDPIDIFPYKQPQMRKVFQAFRAMLANAMRRQVVRGGVVGHA